MARGRPRKTGARNAKGRLLVMPDRGNTKVQARSAMFAKFQGGKADQQVHDQIGRLWAVGLLDGYGCDGAILRDAGRRYAHLYWHRYGEMAPKMGAMERKGQGYGEGGSVAAETAFAILDELARSAGHDAVTSMHALCVNGWWFPDENDGWADALINTALVMARQPVAGILATSADKRRLAGAMNALLAMVGQVRSKAAA